jgi:hypothetical protein
MKQLFVGVVVSLLSLSAVADDMPNGILCGEYGHVDSAEDFDRIEMKPITNAFLMSGSSIVHGSSSYMEINPKAVGLEEGIAKTYFQASHNRVLYIYQQENGMVNIGVSHLVKDSDAGFEDKSVYTQCTYINQPEQVPVKGQMTKVVYRF